MDAKYPESWFAANKTLLETAYLRGRDPWQQSGFGLHTHRTFADWTALRQPVADAVTCSGSFLDVGCANGFLLECVLSWVAERNLSVVPFGLDLSEPLVRLARARLPEYPDHFVTGNALDWEPPRTFDYVGTELVYVPEELQQQYVSRLLDRYLAPGGRLLVAEYRSRDNTAAHLTIDQLLEALGFTVEAVQSGYLEGSERTRIAVVKKTEILMNSGRRRQDADGRLRDV